MIPETPRFQLSVFWKERKLRIVFFYLWGLGVLSGISLDMISPKRDLLFIGSIPSRPVKEYIVPANPPFTIWVAVDGDRTGNSPLPSTPYQSDNLEMRKPGDLGKGFRSVRR
jgi:hypothetical protein